LAVAIASRSATETARELVVTPAGAIGAGDFLGADGAKVGMSRHDMRSVIDRFGASGATPVAESRIGTDGMGGTTTLLRAGSGSAPTVGVETGAAAEVGA